MVTPSFDDVTSGLGRRLAAELDKPPLLTNGKSNITCERCAIDRKLVLNIPRKPWSLYLLVTSLPVSDVTELVKWCSRCEGWWKLVNNSKITRDSKKCHQTTNRKSGSDYSLKIFSPLGDASVAADAFLHGRMKRPMQKVWIDYYLEVGFCLSNETIFSASGHFCNCL
jgi:hypothetical protein